MLSERTSERIERKVNEWTPSMVYAGFFGAAESYLSDTSPQANDPEWTIGRLREALAEAHAVLAAQRARLNINSGRREDGPNT